MARPPLRIAAHNGARSYGGGEIWTARLLRGLQDRGHTVHLFCGHREVAERAREEGVETSLGHLGGQAAAPHALRFSGQLRRFAPDALLLSTFKKVWLGSLAGRLAGVSTVVSRVGLDTDLPDRHWTYQLAYRRWVDAVLVNAEGIRGDFQAAMVPESRARVITVYDGVTLSGPAWSKRDARATLGIPVDAPVVGAVARLEEQKRLDRLLESAALLPDVHVVLAGDGSLGEALREQAVALGISSRVHFLGYRRDVGCVLATLDVFVLTSDREGMANAMLEAMAAGVPVVSTPVSGAHEALGPSWAGVTAGLIVDPDPSAIAGAVQGLLDVHAVRLAMAQEGTRRARTRFSYRGMLKAWEAVLSGDDPDAWHQGPDDRSTG